MSTIVIKGEFSEQELRRILDVIRDIEASRPDETFEVHINDPEMQGDVEDILAAINPLRSGYERVVKYSKR